MPESNLSKELNQVTGGNDDIVIVNCLGDIPGGRTLDCTGFTGVIKAGHCIIKSDSTGVYKPMPVSGSEYGSLTASHSYAGILKASVTVDDPRASIMTIGQVNAAASPYPVTSDMKTYLPHIEFIY